jgi:hypothetical protein
LLISAAFLAFVMCGCVHNRAVSTAADRCPKCGALLFHARPGVTTTEDIRHFAAASKLRDKDQIIADGWMHPGTYCPNGDYEVLETYKP